MCSGRSGSGSSGSGSSGLSIRLSCLTDRKFAARQAASINPSPPDSAAPCALHDSRLAALWSKVGVGGHTGEP